MKNLLFLAILLIAQIATGQNMSTYCNKVDINIYDEQGDTISHIHFTGEYIFTPENDSILTIINGELTRYKISGSATPKGIHMYSLGKKGSEGTIFICYEYVQLIRQAGHLSIDEKFYFE